MGGTLNQMVDSEDISEQCTYKTYLSSILCIVQNHIFPRTINIRQCSKIMDYVMGYFLFISSLLGGNDFLIDGQISSFFPDQHEAKLLTLIMLTQSL